MWSFGGPTPRRVRSARVNLYLREAGVESIYDGFMNTKVGDETRYVTNWREDRISHKILVNLDVFLIFISRFYLPKWVLVGLAIMAECNFCERGEGIPLRNRFRKNYGILIKSAPDIRVVMRRW